MKYDCGVGPDLYRIGGRDGLLRVGRRGDPMTENNNCLPILQSHKAAKANGLTMSTANT